MRFVRAWVHEVDLESGWRQIRFTGTTAKTGKRNQKYSEQGRHSGGLFFQAGKGDKRGRAGWQ